MTLTDTFKPKLHVIATNTLMEAQLEKFVCHWTCDGADNTREGPYYSKKGGSLVKAKPKIDTVKFGKNDGARGRNPLLVLVVTSQLIVIKTALFSILRSTHVLQHK